MLYDRDRLDLGPEITSAWLRASNAVAAGIERGRSTPASRLEQAAREYEHAAAVAIRSPVAADSGELLRAQLGLVPVRTPAARESDDGPSVRRGINRWGRWAQATYGAGRAYERAIQEARWGRAYSNVECVEQSDAWLEANP